MGIYTKKGGIAEKDLNDHITPLLHFFKIKRFLANEVLFISKYLWIKILVEHLV